MFSFLFCFRISPCIFTDSLITLLVCLEKIYIINKSFHIRVLKLGKSGVLILYIYILLHVFMKQAFANISKIFSLLFTFIAEKEIRQHVKKNSSPNSITRYEHHHDDHFFPICMPPRLCVHI